MLVVLAALVAEPGLLAVPVAELVQPGELAAEPAPLVVLVRTEE